MLPTKTISIIKWPRWLHKFYANMFGYFWLPCPNCHRMFGGHEKHGGSIYLGCGVSQMTCSKCKIGFEPPNDIDFDKAPFTQAEINEVYRSKGLM